MGDTISAAASHWTSSFTSWSDSFFSSRKVQLATTAVVSGSVVAGVILGYQNASRSRALKRFKASLDIPEAQQDPVALHISQIRHDHNSVSSPKSQSTSASQQIPQFQPSKEDIRSAELAARARAGDFDNDLILEQLARNRVFLTPQGLEKVRSAFVIIVGLGGVGSHATAALARSGVEKLRLIDFDQVTLSSLNRHAVATLADVGTPKVTAMRRRLEAITPWTNFDCCNELFRSTSAASQLAPWESTGQKPDFVVDAIDNIDSKVELLAYCHKNGIQVISSMGAGCKSDPTRVFIGDISASTEDPLSRSTRRRLRMQGISNGIPTVFSTEKAAPGKASLLPLPDDEFEKGDVKELSALPDFRVRILPVLGTMPAVFGLCVANHIMLVLSGYPHDYLPSKHREKMYDGILAALQGSEERLARWAGEDAVGLRLPVTADDVGYLVEEVWRGRSAVSGLPTRLTLVRWQWPDDESHKDADPAEKARSVLDRSVPGQKSVRLRFHELICMTKDECAKHEKEVLKAGKSPEQVWGKEVCELVRRRKAEEKTFERYRL